MMKFFLAVLAGLLIQSRGQIPDLDEFSGDIDLDLPGQTAESSAASPALPRHHIFAGWEQLEEYVEGTKQLQDDTIIHFQLPGGVYLVAPNVESIATGYGRIAQTMEEKSLQSGQLLKVVLHADGNFSAALYLKEPPTSPVPPPLDISPVPEKHLVGLVSDIQVLERSSPFILKAFVRLQQEAKAKGWTLDRREFIFLPLEPGRVFFGMELIVPAEDDKS